jgi:hypothetical protein
MIKIKEGMDRIAKFINGLIVTEKNVNIFREVNLYTMYAIIKGNATFIYFFLKFLTI